MRVVWTGCGACTSGWIAPPRDATKRAPGGVATTSTGAKEPEHVCSLCDESDGDVRRHRRSGRPDRPIAWQTTRRAGPAVEWCCHDRRGEISMSPLAPAKVVSRAEWLVARKTLLAKEKAI